MSQMGTPKRKALKKRPYISADVLAEEFPLNAKLEVETEVHTSQTSANGGEWSLTLYPRGKNSRKPS